jgi:hypothetical protein
MPTRSGHTHTYTVLDFARGVDPPAGGAWFNRTVFYFIVLCSVRALRALLRCHCRDVSLENVVLSSGGRSAHLIDLGSCSLQSPPPCGYRGKPSYCPPEACEGQCRGTEDRFASDVW